MADWVLDASAVVAFLKREPGSDYVAEHIERAVMTTVNFSEVVAKWVVRSNDPEGTRAVADALPCEIVAINRDIAMSAGLMIARTRSRGLSLGDRVCLAYAKSIGLPVLTTDQAWAEVDVGVDVRLIR